MKIISKFKDYYDYLAGVYGEDPKLILDRSKGFRCNNYSDTHERMYTLILCNQIIQFFKIGPTFYFGSSLEEISRKVTNYDDERGVMYLVDRNEEGFRDRWKIHRIYYPEFSDTSRLNGKIKDFMKECPIFLINLEEETIEEFPLLSDLCINKILPAHEAWIKLSEWLGRRVTDLEKPVPIGDDNTRIQSHGFDTRTSFRPKIKT